MSRPINESITLLKQAKSDIAAAITAKGGTVNTGDGFTSFADDIDSIPSGGGEIGDGNYWVKVIDYDGSVLKEAKLNAGEIFTLPSPPEHPRLTFVNWSASVGIQNNTITVPENDVLIGAVYTTASGATEIDIRFTQVTGKTVQLKFTKTAAGDMVIYWGDYSSNVISSTGAQVISHNYGSYGEHTISIEFDGAYTFNSYISDNTSSVQNSTLTAVFLSSGASLGSDVFYNCRSLETIMIPHGITSIGNNTFYNCFSLISLVIPGSVLTIGDNAFRSCYSLTSVVLPYGITYLGAYSFRSCYALDSITIPSSVSSIETYAFTGGYTLKKILIPSGVPAVKAYLFNGCNNLRTVVLPGSVASIETYAFGSCINVTEYDFSHHTAVPSLLNINAFLGISPLAKIYVPSALATAWKTATNWVTYANYIIGV